MVQPNNSGALSYFVYHDFPATVQTDVVIPADGEHTIELIPEQQFPSGIKPNVPFFAKFEGNIVIQGASGNGAAYSMITNVMHRIPGQGEFTSHRGYVIRAGANQWWTVPLAAFDSISFVPEGKWTDPSEPTHVFDFDGHMLEYGQIVAGMTLEIIAFQNDGVTRVARTPQLISVEGGGVAFYQLDTQLRAGRDFLIR